MEPPRPDDAAPDPKYNAPLFPSAALPELKTTIPLAPDAPESKELIRTEPLLVDPEPLIRDTRPPAEVE